MTNLRLLIDMDGVVANTLSKWLKLINDRFNKSYLISDVIDYDFNFLPREEKLWAFEQLTYPGFFLDGITPIDGSQDILEQYHKDGHDIVFITAPPTRAKNAMYDKYMWLAKYFPFLSPIKDHLVCTSRKDVMLGHILFYDSPKNIEVCKNVGLLVAAMDYPYNREVKPTFRVSSWYEFDEVVKHLIGVIEGTTSVKDKY